MLNGERPDCLLTDAVVSGNKRRSQSGGADSKKAGEVADKAAPPEQVWGPAAHTLCYHFLGRSCPSFLGTPDKMYVKPSRPVVGVKGA